MTKGIAPQTISSTLVAVGNKRLINFGGIVEGMAQQTLHSLDLGKEGVGVVVVVVGVVIMYYHLQVVWSGWK